MLLERRRQLIVFLTLIGILYLSRNRLNKFGPISKLNNKLIAYTPWKILLAGYTIHYFLSHSLSIFGLGAAALPEQHYHPDFQNVRRAFTGLDAAIISTLHVKPKWLRSF